MEDAAREMRKEGKSPTSPPPHSPGGVDWVFWGAVVQDYEEVARQQPKELSRAIQQGVPAVIRYAQVLINLKGVADVKGRYLATHVVVKVCSARGDIQSSSQAPVTSRKGHRQRYQQNVSESQILSAGRRSWAGEFIYGGQDVQLVSIVHSVDITANSKDTIKKLDTHRVWLSSWLLYC